MTRSWTPAQTSAIETSGHDLLVSAGAGSGKTAVLTERIIRRLTDRDDPAEITRMLIVTFTKAAAGELKERISKAVSEALARDPKNKRLARQLTSLDRAKICTIHSFCLDLLRDSGTDAGLPATFRIADDAEIKLLRSSLMNELIDDYYANIPTDRSIDGFASFAENFISTKGDDALADIFLGIETSLSSFTEHIEFIKMFADELRTASCDFSETRCGKEIVDLVDGKLSVYRETFAGALSYITDDPKLTKAYFDAFSGDIDFIDRVRNACKKGRYSAIAEVFKTYTPEKLGILRGYELPTAVLKAKEARTAFSDERKKMCSKFFSLTDKELDGNRIDTADTLEKLYTLLSEFISRFSAEKHSRGIVDFNDLERLAYRLLVKEGKPTAAAKAVSTQFDEVYIDEYQDVNALQDAIFSAVSNGSNRFMVGDIKQSIYAFRGAEPRIFSDYRNSFLPIDKAEDGSGVSVFLSNNFRCDKTVIDFSNLVSACLFTSGRGDIPFYDEDLLIHSKTESESDEPVHIVLIEDGSLTDDKKARPGSGEANTEESADDDESISEGEAEYVAGEIARLLKEGKKNDGSPINPSDIAILMRSAKAQASAFETAFERYGIPLYNNVDSDFFENAEVLLALCILNAIDNPTRDIYLAGALRSPVFGFTLDELIKIRRHTAEGCLFEALCEYCKSCDFPKGTEFIERLEHWRQKAESMPVDRLVWYIYRDTDLPALVFDKGDLSRRANLMLLYEYARRFEASSFKGLYNFIRYINDILENKAQLENAKVIGEADDTVKLMTIHQSKGLEFPVCFICGTGKRFNESDLRANIVMERSLGIAMKLADSTGFARYDTPIRQAIVKRLSDSQLEEEMRVLYVAMTRARERLYVTAQVPDATKLLDTATDDAAQLSRYVVLKNGGYMKWILTALEHHKLTCGNPAPVDLQIISGMCDIVKDSPKTADSPNGEAAKAPSNDRLEKLIRERFEFVYPYTAASKIPAKLSVSKLVPTLLDEDAAELEDTSCAYSFTEKRPMFLEGQVTDLPATAAERGTATHLFMQFCDFSRFTAFSDDLKETVREEAARLAGMKYITPRASSLVDVERLARFFESDTFAEICQAKNVYREHRFNVALPASDFTTDEGLSARLEGETVLVQGVIDCFYDNPDGTVTLIDYKTDRIPSGMSESEAEAMLTERHRLQLSYYKSACERISAKKVTRVAIYSFGLGRAVKIDM